MEGEEHRRVEVILTAKGTGDRLSGRYPLLLQAGAAETRHSIRVDASVRYQTLMGFGGAFTESAAVTFWKLPEKKRNEVIRAYFGPGGHGYTLGRTHINSCDFSLGNYSYDDIDGDFALSHFTIDHDRGALIPMLQAAMRIAGPIKLLASPWSPPAWMKTTGRMNGGGTLRPECLDAWARYYCRYVREYRAQRIPIWGLTVQNEPEAAQLWESCLYSAEEERDFVRDHLGPMLSREGLADVKLLIWDHNRDRMFERARIVLDDPAARLFVWGTAFHWYCGDHFDNVQALHDAYPEKQLLFSEGCREGGPHLGSWELGERYAHSMINDLNRWTVGWIDWNLLLDRTGGPNHAENLCSAPLIANTKSGRLHYQSSYFYIGHFSRYLRPGAVRILSVSTSDHLESTAFLNTDGRIAVVVLNRGSLPVHFTLKHGELSAASVSPAHSIATYLLRE